MFWIKVNKSVYLKVIGNKNLKIDKKYHYWSEDACYNSIRVDTRESIRPNYMSIERIRTVRQLRNREYGERARSRVYKQSDGGDYDTFWEGGTSDFE